MTIEIWLAICLFASVCINAVLILFSRDISVRYYVLSDNLSYLVEILNSYQSHLKDVYSMEMFYGDENLEHLLGHTSDLIDIIDNEYGEISLIENIVEYEEEYEEETEQHQPEADVFYGGTRRSNS